MKVVHTIADARSSVREARSGGKTVGFIPTMGFLHEGHVSLVERSAKETGYQVMSIFVNRLQFNDPKDFASYPKDLERDIAVAEKAGVDLLFMPDDAEMYHDNLTTVNVEKVTNHLCGAHRPGHFQGVFTVVSKLFNIVQPDIAVFGQKDIQQAVSLEKMVADLNFPIKIIIAPIMREKDGLAMSSRNKHLDETNRQNALVISKSLRMAGEMLQSGEMSAGIISEAMKNVIRSGNPKSIDYISVVRYSDLSPVDVVTEKSVIAVAAFFGTTRLIDNMIVDPGKGKVECVY